MNDNDGDPKPRIEIIPTTNPEQERSARRNAAWGRVWPLLGLSAGLLAGWVALPFFLYGHQEQPLAFNHAVHTKDAGMTCDNCHGFRADGSFAGIPTVKTCADCHSEAQGTSKAERKLVDDFVTPGREIPWLVYSRQPDNVYFSHAPHVRRAGIECRRCHGDKGLSTGTAVYQFNRISTYSRNIWGPRISGGGPNPWDSMKMSACTRCHRERGVRDHCLMCHK